MVEPRSVFANDPQKNGALGGLGRDAPPVPGASEFLVGGSERTPDARMAEKQALDRGYIYIGCGIAGVPGGTLIGPEPILNLDAAIFEWDGPLS
jgi:hypothetical protein